MGFSKLGDFRASYTEPGTKELLHSIITGMCERLTCGAYCTSRARACKFILFSFFTCEFHVRTSECSFDTQERQKTMVPVAETICPPFRRVERYLLRPNPPRRSGSSRKNALTETHTNKYHPASFFHRPTRGNVRSYHTEC